MLDFFKDPAMPTYPSAGLADGNESVLCLPPPTARTAGWLQDVSRNFRGASPADSVSHRAAIVLRTPRGVFAVVFGHGGRSLIDLSLIELGWGRRIALNLLYDDLGNVIGQGSAIRSERKKRLGARLNTTVQTGQPVTLSQLGFDSAREVLREVTVKVKRKQWGVAVTGADPFRMKWGRSTGKLHRLVQELQDIYGRTHYRQHFQFIDNVQEVSSAKIRDSVWSAIAANIKAKRVADYGFNPEAHVDLSLADFALYGAGGAPRGGHRLSDCSLNAYVKALVHAGALGKLDAAALADHELVARYDGAEFFKAPVRNWLEGEVRVGSTNYLVSEGVVYEVAASYLAELDHEVDSISTALETKLGLPDLRTVPRRKVTKKVKGIPTTEYKQDEAAFNVHASARPNRLLLDAKNVVTVPGRTDQVEVCDVLTDDGEFLHVKRKTSSKAMSHLIAQALVSAELLLDSTAFRSAARSKVNTECATQGKPASHFLPFFPTAGSPSFSVVLVVITNKWWRKGAPRPASVVLPFFSKINLRAALRTLRARGVEIHLVRVRE